MSDAETCKEAMQDVPRGKRLQFHRRTEEEMLNFKLQSPHFGGLKLGSNKCLVAKVKQEIPSSSPVHHDTGCAAARPRIKENPDSKPHLQS